MESFAEPKYYRQLKLHLQDYINNPQFVKMGEVNSTLSGLANYQRLYNHPPDNYEFLLRQLNSINTKRIIFDARQATVFDKSDPIKVDGLKLFPPFKDFYLEFTEGIEVEAQEPGYVDKLVSIIYIHEMSKIPVFDGKEIKEYPASMLICMFWNEKTFQWTDRCFRLNVENKLVFPAVQNVRNTINPSEVPTSWNDNSWFLSKMEIPEIPNRKIGFWEDAIQSYGDLLFWIFAYISAKSIKIEEVKISRQVRRAMERKGIMPNPWHRVTVEPKLVDRDFGGETETGREVGYRFDVISHLRFNRHKLKDGSYRYRVEIVPNHQRGLSKDIYIPKTYEVKGNKTILPEMKHYLDGEKIP